MTDFPRTNDGRLAIHIHSESEKYERRYLTAGEYASLRAIFAAISEMDDRIPNLTKRIKTIPNGWRNFRAAESMMYNLLQEILETVPKDKLSQIQRELNNTKLIIKVTEAPVKQEQGITYLKEDVLNRIVDRACANDCLFCSKSGSEVRKCQLRKDVEDTYQFGLAVRDYCPFAGTTILTKNSIQDD